MLPSNYTYKLFNNTYLSICIDLPTKCLPTYYVHLPMYYLST
jgi:hypothetical protein